MLLLPRDISPRTKIYYWILHKIIMFSNKEKLVAGLNTIPFPPTGWTNLPKTDVHVSNLNVYTTSILTKLSNLLRDFEERTCILLIVICLGVATIRACIKLSRRSQVPNSEESHSRISMKSLRKLEGRIFFKRLIFHEFLFLKSKMYN